MAMVLRATRTWIAIICATSSLIGCQLYQPDLRQGNDITQAKLNQLKPNLTKEEVQQIMGSPVLTPVLNIDYWDYAYSFTPGNKRGTLDPYKVITLNFKNDRLQFYSSDDWQIAGLPKR